MHVLREVLEVAILAELGENPTELPVDWRLMSDRISGDSVLCRYSSVKKTNTSPA